MSFEAVNWAWKQRKLTVHEKMVLLALANRHNPDYGCFPSISKIVEDVEFSKSTVIRSIKNLQVKGYLSVEAAKRENGSQTSNRYFLSFEVEPQCQADTPPSVPETLPPVSERHPHKQVISKQVSKTILRSVELGLKEFWNCYPRKIGKTNAEKAFIKASHSVGVDVILDAIKPFAVSVAKKEKKFIPHPATWLNQGRWDDELEEIASTSSSDYLDRLFRGGVLGIENK